jgi:hypothetical protein
MSFDGDGGDTWLADLKNMEKVVEIFEILGGRTEPQVANLVTPYRRWVRTDDVMLREAPFSASQKVPHRIYLFRDLLVIGRHKEPNRAGFLAQRGSLATSVGEDSGSTQTGNSAISKRRSFRLSFTRRKSGTNASTNNTTEKRGSFRVSDADTYKVKLTHYLPLSQCTIKSIPHQLDNSFGTQLTHVCRIHVNKDGKPQVITKVEKLEFWFPIKEMRDDLEQEIQSLIDEEEEIARAQAGETSRRNIPSLSTESTSTSNAGERAWAKNRPKVLRLRAKESGEIRSRAGSGDSEDTTATTQREGISLADLAQRYNVDFAQKPSLENTAKFSVEFGEGQMGFSLSSGDGIGVIIGRLAPQSFADLGGCEIGDRLDSVNGIEIELNTSWQQAVEIIKAAGRPVTLGFVRNVQVQAKVQEKEEKTLELEEKTAPSSGNVAGGAKGGAGGNSGGAPSSSNPNAGPAGRRRWAANRARHQSGHGGLIALDDLEKMYKSTAGRETTSSIGGKSEDGKSTKDDDDDNGSVIADDDDDTTVAASPRSPLPRSPTSEQPAFLQPQGPSNSKQILEQFASMCEIEEERICVAVLAEILQTEKAYVSDLRALIKEYVMPLRRATKRKRCKDLDSASLMCEHGSLRNNCSKQSTESGPLLQADDVRTIFMNVETLVKVNAELLKAIEDGVTQFGETTDLTAEDVDIADGLTQLVEVFSSNFEKITPFFTMYALYCHQYPQACERLQKMRVEDDEADTFLREREAKSTQNSLRSLLIKPVQRICRYPLLFQELLKRCRSVENVYPDRKKGNIHLVVEVIQGTANTVEKIANDVNQKVQVQETIGSIMNVFHELGGAAENGDDEIKAKLLAPSRRYIRSEEVFFKEAPFDGELQPRRLYLFNDLIILATERDPSMFSGGALNAASNTLKRRSMGASRTRAKSFGNLVAGFGLGGGNSSNGNGSNSGTNSNSHSNLPNGGGDNVNGEMPPWTHQASHWIELTSGDVRPLPKPDDAGWYGFRIKSIRRITQTDDNGANGKALEKRKSTKRITWGVGVKESPPIQERHTKVVTSIQKYEIWMALRDRLQNLLSDIEDKILALSVLQQNASKGMSKFGATQQKKTRSWIQKKNSKEDNDISGGTGGLGGVTRKNTAGSIDAKDALNTISKKYSSTAGGFSSRGSNLAKMSSSDDNTPVNVGAIVKG